MFKAVETSIVKLSEVWLYVANLLTSSRGQISKVSSNALVLPNSICYTLWRNISYWYIWTRHFLMHFVSCSSYTLRTCIALLSKSIKFLQSRPKSDVQQKISRRGKHATRKINSDLFPSNSVIEKWKLSEKMDPFWKTWMLNHSVIV